MLAVIALCMGVFHYALEEKDFFIYEFNFSARAFALLSLGMLLSYVPKWKPKKFNIHILIVLVLAVALFYLAYNEKDYWISLGIIGLFMVAIYCTSNISFGGKVFDIIGQMSARMYVYMAFVSMLDVMGLDNYRLLFVIDVALSAMDLLLNQYYNKYKALQKQMLEQANS